jgi:diacylglycerol kinase
LSILIVLPLDLWERAILLLVTMFVLVLELLNSSLERLVDLAKPRLHEYAGDIKDLMAGSVLLAAMFALVLGLLILGPKLADIAMRL